MYPQGFEYYSPATLEETVNLLAEHRDEDPELIAGGHSLLPAMKSGLSSPSVLIDISDLDDLVGIDGDDEATTIGAMTKYVDIAESERLQEHHAFVAHAAGKVGDIQVRNRGTFGGNIAHSDPASDLPGVAIAANAKIHATGPDGQRTINADDFFVMIYTTALEEDEILTHVTLPTPPEGQGTAYEKKPSPSSGYAIVGVAATATVENETVTGVNVAANGATQHAVRLDTVEETFVDGAPTEDRIEAAAAEATSGIDDFEFMEDVQASVDYRKQLLESYTARALTTAVERAGE